MKGSPSGPLRDPLDHPRNICLARQKILPLQAAWVVMFSCHHVIVLSCRYVVMVPRRIVWDVRYGFLKRERQPQMLKSLDTGEWNTSIHFPSGGENGVSSVDREKALCQQGLLQQNPQKSGK